MVEIKGSSSKNIIISVIQDWIRRKSNDLEIQIIGLQIFKLESSKVIIVMLQNTVNTRLLWHADISMFRVLRHAVRLELKKVAH